MKTLEINTKQIKDKMDELGIGTRELAYRMNVRETWVYAVLSGKFGKTFYTVCKFAKALDCDPKDLLI